MCLAIPLRVEKIEADQAIVGDGRRTFLVYRGGVKIKKGDYVLIQQKMIVKKVSLQEAQEVLRLSSKEVRMKSGVRLTALYAYGCQAVPTSSKIGQAIHQYLTTGQNESDLGLSLMSLEPWQYYLAIIEHKYPFLDERPRDNFYLPIVRAYWFGSPMKLFRPGSLVAPKNMNPSIHQKGFNSGKDDVGVLFRRNGVRPYHNWVVLAKAAMQSLDIPAVLALANRCLILPARIKRIFTNGLIVAWQPLKLVRGRIRCAAPKEIIVSQGYVKNLKVSDVISLHYGEARERLTPIQTARLKKYTQLAIDELNAAIKESKKK